MSIEILGTSERDDGTLLTCPSAAIVHAIGLILVIGYPITYYFHLRKFDRHVHRIGGQRETGTHLLTVFSGHHKNNAH